MNLFDALSASLTSEQVTGLPGNQKDGTGLAGLFAQLVDTSGEGAAASPEALLANIEALQSSTAPSDGVLTGLSEQNAALSLLLPGEPSSESILIDSAAAEGTDASLLLQTLTKESSSSETATDETSALLSIAVEKASETDEQTDGSEIQPSPVPLVPLPEIQDGPDQADIQPLATNAPDPGLLGVPAGKGGPQPNPGTRPPPPIPLPDANSAAPGQSEKDEQGRVINPAGLQEQPARRAGQGSSSQAAPEFQPSGTSESPPNETTGPRPGSRGTNAPPQPALFKTVINPASGQALLQVLERTDSDAKGPGVIDSGVSGIQLRAVGNGPATPAQQSAHVPLNSLAVHIAQQAKNGIRRFDIRLDPPELGRIEVRLDVRRDGQVNTHLVVERTETLDLLQRDARALERALQNAGLNTSEGGMKFSLRDDGMAQNSPQGDRNEAGNGNSRNTDREGDRIIDDQDSLLHPERKYVATSGLDIRI